MRIYFNEDLLFIEAIEEIERIAPINDLDNHRYSNYIECDSIEYNQIMDVLHMHCL